MIHIPKDNQDPKDLPYAILQAPTWVYLPMEAYGGKFSPIIEDGTSVKKYQTVAAREGFWESYIHSPVSGTVNSLQEISGQQFLVIQNDFLEDALPAKKCDLKTLDSAEILRIICLNGIEGQGGARFPTHIKYDIGEHKIDTLIINGAECEPYLTADYAVLKYFMHQLIDALHVLQRLFKAKQIVFGIERHNSDLKEYLESTISTSNLPITIKWLPNTYPQGGELQLIKSITGKEIPKGSLPAKMGIMVSNVGTLWSIYNAFYKGIPTVERMVTVYGHGIEHQNYLMKIGTPVEHIMEIQGISKTTESMSIISGGPMMGREVSSLKTPVNKGTSGVLFLHTLDLKEQNCIGCGYCVDVCPQRLMPLEFVRFGQQGNVAKLNSYNLKDCIECGACAYACPSHVPLMQNIFKGKTMVKNQYK